MGKSDASVDTAQPENTFFFAETFQNFPKPGTCANAANSKPYRLRKHSQLNSAIFANFSKCGFNIFYAEFFA
jgi:hypothetical protein